MAHDGDDTSTKRSLGCLVCRSRKVRCDRATPDCANCERLGVQCPGYDEGPRLLSRRDLRSSVEGIYRASGVEKRKTGSCEECRKAKSRCSKTLPRCRRCIEKSLRCLYPRGPVSQDQERYRSSMSAVSDTNSPTAVLARVDRTPADLTSIDGHLGWLFDDSIPQDRDRLRSLVTCYFERVHTTRCLGFVHKPSFIQAFDSGSLIEQYGEALVNIVAALGARILFQDNPDNHCQSFTSFPGQAWMDKARDLAMRDIAHPSLNTLMTLILISEYAMNVESYALAFTLIGSCYRIMRLLGLESPKRVSQNPSPAEFTQTESERRVLWSCCILDSIVGGGVDANLFWKDEFPNIPLPCDDAAFVAQIQPRSEEVFTIGVFRDPTSFRRLGLRSHLIYLAYMRTQVLRLIRSKGQTVEIWSPQSPFLRLIEQLESWHANVPAQLVINDLNTYIHKELNILGAVYTLHFWYNVIVCDLTRVSLPGYDFPLASAFESAPYMFRKQCQDRCRYHADEMSRLIKQGLAHGWAAFDDQHCQMAAFESCKIQIIHTTTATSNSPEERQRATVNMRLNMKLLEMTHFWKQKTNSSHRALLPLLARFGFHELVSEWRQPQNSLPQSEEPEVTGPAETAYLSNLAPFRVALSQVQDREKGRKRQRLEPLAPENEVTAAAPVVQPQPSGMSPAGPAAPTMQDLFASSQVPSVHTGAPDASDAFYQQHSGLEDVPEGLNGMDQPVEDYIRLAGEMSSYITWPEFPYWPEFDPDSYTG